MRHCIVHVGIHKTGSTAIQLSLGRNRAALEQVGVLYPEVAGQEHLARGHHGLAAHLNVKRKGGPSNFGAADLAHTLSTTRAEFVVISAEGLSSASIPRDRISELISSITSFGFDVTVVAFVRPQAGLINSTYLEHVQTFRFGGSSDDYIASTINSRLYRLGERLARWAEQPNIRFVVVPYTSYLIGPRISETLLEAGGIPPDQIAAARLSPTENANVSIGNIAVGAFRIVRHLHPEIVTHPERARVQTFATALARQRGWMREKFVGLDQVRADIIRDRFAEENEAFARSHMERPWHEIFAEDYAKPWIRNEVDPDAVSPELQAQFRDFAHLTATYASDGEGEPALRTSARTM